MRSISIRYYNKLQLRYNIFLPYDTIVGYGFYIGHGFGLVVNGTAIIGNNVNLSQFTTIGSNHNHAAAIGDDVYIGPSVCIIENVKIGSHSAIGAGSVVLSDVPEKATFAGNPGMVKKAYTNIQRVGNWYPTEFYNK